STAPSGDFQHQCRRRDTAYLLGVPFEIENLFHARRNVWFSLETRRPRLSGTGRLEVDLCCFLRGSLRKYILDIRHVYTSSTCPTAECSRPGGPRSILYAKRERTLDSWAERQQR